MKQLGPGGVTVMVGHGGKRKRSLRKGPGDWVVEGRQDSLPAKDERVSLAGSTMEKPGPLGFAGVSRARAEPAKECQQERTEDT